MVNNPIISKHLEETQAFSNKDPPVLITSGQSLTPFFINTEKLCRDENISAFLKENKDNAKGIIEHAIALYEENPDFRQDIEIIADTVKPLLYNKPQDDDLHSLAISGGMRRDLIFSGPVANLLDLPHISLYKQEIGQPINDDKIEVLFPSGKDERVKDLPFYVVHISDLLTKGFSCYDIDPETKRRTGWMPMQRQFGAEIYNLVTVVTRQQGGEERLECEQEIYTTAQVAIDQDFLQKHSSQPEVDIAYVKDERGWTENYLKEHNVDVLVPYFDPNGGKLTRARRFFDSYKEFLTESGLMPNLEKAVQENYNTSLNEVVGGK